MKGLLKVFIALGYMACFISQSFGQSKTDTITLKKGEVLDILLLIQKHDREADLKSYIQTAFPIAKKMSYQSLPGFKITNNYKGNLQPDLLILGKWNNIKLREDFLNQIIVEIPEFHKFRRKIWSYFGLQYFEIKEDLSFKIHRDKFQVASAYWLKNKQLANKFFKKWKNEIQKSNGEILIQLEDGKSPFGYQYNPQYFVITSWENKADFQFFQEKMEKLKLDNIEHINEFILK